MAMAHMAMWRRPMEAVPSSLGKSIILEVAELACATFFIPERPTPSCPQGPTSTSRSGGGLCEKRCAPALSLFRSTHRGELSRDSQVPFSPPSFWQGLRFAVQNVRCVHWRQSFHGVRGWSRARLHGCCAVQWRLGFVFRAGGEGVGYYRDEPAKSGKRWSQRSIRICLCAFPSLLI